MRTLRHAASRQEQPEGQKSDKDIPYAARNRERPRQFPAPVQVKEVQPDEPCEMESYKRLPPQPGQPCVEAAGKPARENQ